MSEQKNQDQITRDLMEFMNPEKHEVKILPFEDENDKTIPKAIDELLKDGFEMFPYPQTTNGINCRFHFRRPR